MNTAGHPDAVNQIIETIETAKQGGFAAARGTDKRRHLVPPDIHINIVQCLFVAVEQTP